MCRWWRSSVDCISALDCSWCCAKFDHGRCFSRGWRWRGSGRPSIYFFFSSRRRHTRSDRDWSSDVCSSDLPSNLWVMADQTRLEQVLMNLLTNAVKYTPNGGAITIGSRRVDGEGEIQVKDKIGRASCRERV